MTCMEMTSLWGSFAQPNSFRSSPQRYWRWSLTMVRPFTAANIIRQSGALSGASCVLSGLRPGHRFTRHSKRDNFALPLQ